MLMMMMLQLMMMMIIIIKIINLPIWLNCSALHFTWTLSYDISAICELDFLNPTLFPPGYDYYASARMAASQLNGIKL